MRVGCRVRAQGSPAPSRPQARSLFGSPSRLVHFCGRERGQSARGARNHRALPSRMCPLSRPHTPLCAHVVRSPHTKSRLAATHPGTEPLRVTHRRRWIESAKQSGCACRAAARHGDLHLRRAMTRQGAMSDDTRRGHRVRTELRTRNKPAPVHTTSADVYGRHSAIRSAPDRVPAD